MPVGATSQNRDPDFALPAGIHRRQAWRPAGLRGVDSILAGIASRTRPFDRHRARLTAWHEQFVQRSQPFVGWPPLTKPEWDAHDTQYSFGGTRRRAGSRQSSRKSHLPLRARLKIQAPETHLQRFPAEQQRPQEAYASRQSISGVVHTAAKGAQLTADLSGPHERPLEAAVLPVATRARRETADDRAGQAHSSEASQLPAKDASHPRRAWGSEPPPAAPTQRREEQPLERPALRLAILRPINTAAGTIQRKESGPLSAGSSRFSMAETNDLRAPEHLLIEEQSALPLRLVASGSSWQRQEVRDGFPVGMRGDLPREDEHFLRSSERNVGARTVSFSELWSDRIAFPGFSRDAQISEPAAPPSVALPECKYAC